MPTVHADGAGALRTACETAPYACAVQQAVYALARGLTPQELASRHSDGDGELGAAWPVNGGGMPLLCSGHGRCSLNGSAPGSVVAGVGFLAAHVHLAAHAALAPGSIACSCAPGWSGTDCSASECSWVKLSFSRGRETCL